MWRWPIGSVTQDQIAFPMARYSPVRDFCRSLADHDHVRDLARVLRGRPSRTPDGTAGAHVLMQVNSQVTAALHIECLVNRFGAHPHLLPVREHCRQVVTDLGTAPGLVDS
jgi:hypothetical protein